MGHAGIAEIVVNYGCRGQTEGYIIGQRVKFLTYGRRYMEQTGTHAVKEIKYRTYDYKEKGHLE